MRMLSLLGIFLCVASIAVADEQGATVPIKKVTVFSSGVSYFEHTGKLRDDADIVLKFRKDQINDVLKSLVVLDQAGQVGGVSYASQEPIARALKSFGIDISENPTLGQLLQQIRGTGVVATVSATPIKGRIVSVEKKTKHIIEGNVLVDEEFLNLYTDDGLKSLPLKDVSGITLDNAQLNTELGKALTLLVQNRDTDRKPVTISFRGKGERDVLIGYINEAPIWKTSYRIVLDDKEKSLMQGWAIVENTSESDWSNVELTLVSGRPISFVQDLYTPLFLKRPVVEPELYQFLKPQRYEEGVGEDKTIAAPAPMMMGKSSGGRRSARATVGVPVADSAPAMAMNAEASSFSGEGFAGGMTGIQAAARGAEAGELFTYKIATPVTLERQKSSMLPIINQQVPVRKVSIYNAAVLPQNPLNGFWLTNGTDMSLLAGPVTVFEGGTYAGDAQIGNLAPQDKRLLSYGIDLKVRVDSSFRQDSMIVSGKINRGVLEIGRKWEFKQDYVIKNKDNNKRTLLIEHPRDQSRKLVKPEKPVEQTEQLLRFETEVPANATQTFNVVEQRIDIEAIGILPADVNTLMFYARTGEIPQSVRDTLAEVIKRKTALVESERALGLIQEKINVVRVDENNTRQNLNTVTRNTPAYTRFEKKLLDLESNLEQLQSQFDQKRQEVEQMRKALEDYVANLNID